MKLLTLFLFVFLLASAHVDAARHVTRGSINRKLLQVSSTGVTTTTTASTTTLSSSTGAAPLLSSSSSSTGALLSSSTGAALPSSTAAALTGAATGGLSGSNLDMSLFVCDADQTCGSNGQCTPIKDCAAVNCDANALCWNGKCIPGAAGMNAASFSCMQASSTGVAPLSSSTGVAPLSSSTGVAPLPLPSSTGAVSVSSSSSGYVGYTGGFVDLQTGQLNANLQNLNIPQLNLVYPQPTTATANTFSLDGILDATATETIHIDADAILIKASVYVTQYLNSTNCTGNCTSLNLNNLGNQNGNILALDPQVATLITSVQGQVSQRTQSLVTLLKGQQYSQYLSKLQTTSVSLQPLYNYESGDLLGYTGVNSLSFQVSPISQAGSILDAMTNAGATRLDGIEYVASDQLMENARMAAIQAATQSAVKQINAAVASLNTFSKAQLPTSLSFVSLDLSPESFLPPTPLPADITSFQSLASTPAAPTPILGGNLDITATAHLRVKALH